MRLFAPWLAALALAGCAPPDPCANSPATFSAIDRCIVQPTCAAFASCHSAAGHMGDLDLATDPYNAIVGAPCKNSVAAARGWHEVTAGDPSTSFLYQKLVLPAATDKPPHPGDPLQNGGLGDRMPQTGQTLDGPSIDQIKQWIAAGAQND